MFKYLLILTILISYLQVDAQTGPTRAQLQLNNATGYNNQSGAFRKLLYMPIDKQTTTDSGAIAFKNNNIHLKRDTGWVQVTGVQKLNDSTIVIGQDTISVNAGSADTEWVSVTDFGAVPNDLSNDYTTNIQAALNSGAQCVLFPQGQYKITTQVKIKSNTTLLGYGAVLIREAEIDNMLINDADGVTGGYLANENIRFYGLTIDGNKSVYPTNCTMVAIGHATKIMFKDCEIKNIPGNWHGIELNAVQDALVEGCYFHDGSTQEQLQLDVAGGTALFPWFGPFDHAACRNIVIDGNLFMNGVGNVSAAMGSHSGGESEQHDGVIISNNTMKNFGNTLAMYNYKNLVITGNTLDSALQVGMTAYRTNVTGVQNWVIANNNFYRTANGAMNLFNIKGLTITGNNIDSTVQYGLSVNTSRDVNITNNIIRRAGTNASIDYGGIEIATDTNVYVANNTFLKNPAGYATGVYTIKATNIVGATVENNTFQTPGTTSVFNQFTGTGLKVGMNIINGAVTPGITTKTANYTYLPTDGVLNIDATSGPIAITVDPKVFNKDGLLVRKTSADANAITITPSSGTINGGSSIILNTQYQTALIKSDYVNLDALLSAGMSISAPVTSGTPGSVLFVDASNNLGQDNANLFYDNANDRLGIGTNTPSQKLEVLGKLRMGFAGNNEAIEIFDAGRTIGSGGAAHIGFKASQISFSTSGVSVPGLTSKVYFEGGSTSAGTAPVIIDSGALMTTPEKYAIENNGLHFYWTNRLGTRFQLDQQSDGNGIYSNDGTVSSARLVTLGTNALSFNATNNTGGAVNIANTGNGDALSISSTGTGPTQIISNTGTGLGLQIVSNNGTGLNVTTDNTNAVTYTINPTSTNTIDRVANYIRRTTGTAANNMGGSIGYQLEDDGGSTYSAAQIKWVQTNAAAASRTTAFTFSVLNAGTSNDRFSILGNGQHRAHAYGTSAFPALATTYAGYDASGNMVERLAGFRQTATVNVTANDTETTLIGSGAGSLVIPANTMVAGKTYRITLRGTLSTDATNPASMNWRIKLGSTEVLASGNMGIGANRSNVPYDLKAEITCRSTGALGTVIAQGMVLKEDGPGAKGMPPTVTFIDTTVSNTVSVTIDMTDGSAGNNVYAYILIFEEI